MALAATSLIPQATVPVKSRWRRIVTPIPAPESVPLLQQLRAVEPRSMAGMPPIIWHDAQGFLVRDRFGNQWIDLTSGIVMANSGHSHPRVLEAIRRAASDPLLATYAFASEPRLRLVERLVTLSPIPDSKAILFSSGTEATECALALMRRHGQTLASGKVGILSLLGHYHGRTLGAQFASGGPAAGDWIPREDVRHYQIPPPRDGEDGAACLQRGLEDLSRRGIGPADIAGIILEPVPGTTTRPVAADFATALAAWARRHDILLSFDEIQCGCGRTGKFFGSEHIGVVPDLILLGKGLSSSLPVSAVLGRRGLLDQPGPGEMSSTHGGNPLCAAAALANLEVIAEEGLVERAAQTGALVRDRLLGLRAEFGGCIHAVEGCGLFLSVHLRAPGAAEPGLALADAVAEEAVRRGVLMFPTGRGYLKFTPPLGIDPEAALEAVDVIRECLAAKIGRPGA